MEYICAIGKRNRSCIENDIFDFSGYGDPSSQTDERLKMLKNYNRKVPDEIKKKAHDDIKNSFRNSYKQRNQKIKNKKKENHEKFFLGSMLISFFKSQDIKINYLDNTLYMIELYQTKNYFSKDLFLESEIDEFKFSEVGIKFKIRKTIFYLIQEILLNHNID